MSYDSISYWLHSVEEAHHILRIQEHHLQQTAASIFRLFRPSIRHLLFQTRRVIHPTLHPTQYPPHQFPLFAQIM
jgi:hypothetical protein